MAEQLSLFVTTVTFPNAARAAFLSSHEYGEEWAVANLRIRFSRLAKLLKQNGFKSNYKLRLVSLPGICFAMRPRGR